MKRPPPEVQACSARLVAGAFNAIAERMETEGWSASKALAGFAFIARRMAGPVELDYADYAGLRDIRRTLVDGRDEPLLAAELRRQASAAIEDAERLEALAASRARRKPRPKGGKHR